MNSLSDGRLAFSQKPVLEYSVLSKFADRISSKTFFFKTTKYLLLCARHWTWWSQRSRSNIAFTAICPIMVPCIILASIAILSATGNFLKSQFLFHLFFNPKKITLSISASFFCRESTLDLWAFIVSSNLAVAPSNFSCNFISFLVFSFNASLNSTSLFL